VTHFPMPIENTVTEHSSFATPKDDQCRLFMRTTKATGVVNLADRWDLLAAKPTSSWVESPRSSLLELLGGRQSWALPVIPR